MLENFSRLYKQGARALQTDDRQTTDGRAIAFRGSARNPTGDLKTLPRTYSYGEEVIPSPYANATP